MVLIYSVEHPASDPDYAFEPGKMDPAPDHPAP
jgi:hypothetical protein